MERTADSSKVREIGARLIYSDLAKHDFLIGISLLKTL